MRPLCLGRRTWTSWAAPPAASPAVSPAVATPASQALTALRAAYTSGHVFGGRLDVPAIDRRPYMERELDMHNSHQRFAVRKCVTQRMGHSDNLVVWFTKTYTNPPAGTPRASQTLDALSVMDPWLMKLRANPQAGMAANKPPMAVDACFDATGALMQVGAVVWDGILDSRASGACTQALPLYGTSRTAASAPIEGGIYVCARKPVDQALADGTCAPWLPNATEVAQLKQIFPQGVCDYSRPDQARPG